MNTKRTIRVALAALASAGLLAGVLSPAQAATRSTVVLHETNTLTGLNSSVTGYSLVTNSAVGYLTRSGFNYYDDKKNLIANSVFGSYKISKSSKTDFRTQWTVNPGRVWSDGTPITGVDLLLSHVLSSNAYSIAAGLGDPKDKVKGAEFKTSGYSSTYDSNVVGDPELSADEMSVTLRFKQKIANWDQYGPGVSPVHALVLMAEGEKELQSASQNLAAKARFLKAFKEKDTKVLKAIAQVWSNDYNITNIDSKTNPLLLISNGGYMVKSAVDKQSVTLVENPKYNSGPAKVGKIDTLVYKFITDGTAASQALANGELDVYNGQADADGKAALDKIKGIKVIGGTSATYEHVDLRLNAFPGQPEYKGIFAASGGQKALDLRRAFLLSIPREEIIEKLIKPLNPNIPVLNTAFSVSGEGIYDSIVRNNGSKYFVGNQAALNKRAASLVKKWYPDAMKNPLRVNLLVPGNNSRRADEYALIKANARKVGFDVVGDVQVAWGGLLTNSKYDASFFGWSAGSVLQVKSPTIFKSTGTQNYNGARFTAVDPIYEALSAPRSQTVAVQNYIKIERYFFENAATLPIFQHPSITAVNPDLKGIKPAPLNPNIVWNYWEWSY